ncbi:MAG: HTTM domain-containing protein [Proteobacteria bacterium]|nr:HTTM domain-containing protein [Pseudomonadota bacterium]
MIARLWNRWVDHCDRDVDVRPLALMRIFVSLCILGDLVRVLQLGLLDDFYLRYADGGLSGIEEYWWFLDDVVGRESAGFLAYGVTVTCAALILLGIGVRPAILVGVLFYAQLGHGYPPGDRAIDRILRLMLIFLFFTPAHQKWALANVLFKREAAVKAKGWIYDAVKWFLIVVYLCAGIGKLMNNADWMGLGKFSPLYRILTDPLASNLDPNWWYGLHPLFRFGSWATIIIELTPILLLTRFCPHWAVGGFLIHFGIAVTMNLGMFSWGMLAMYPMLFAPWIFDDRGLPFR